jgi:hypothetical protein
VETLGEWGLWSFLEGAPEAKTARPSAIRGGKGHYVSSYLELATKVAELQFLNRDWVLLFRGQTAECRI